MQTAQPTTERMTAEERRTTRRDFKTTINGQRCVLRCTERDICLIPVVIMQEQK